MSLFESLMRFIVFNVGIKPHVYKNELRYKGIINRMVLMFTKPKYAAIA